MLFGSNLDSEKLLQTEFYSSQVHMEKPQPWDLRMGSYGDKHFKDTLM